MAKKVTQIEAPKRRNAISVISGTNFKSIGAPRVGPAFSNWLPATKVPWAEGMPSGRKDQPSGTIKESTTITFNDKPVDMGEWS